MKAFEVYYNTPGSSGNRAIVLSVDEALVSADLGRKDRHFRPNGSFGNITRITEIPFSSVRLTDLTVEDLLKILGK